MSRTNLYKARLAVEGLESRNLTTGFSAQGRPGERVGLTTVAQSPGLASVTQLPNPDDPFGTSWADWVPWAGSTSLSFDFMPRPVSSTAVRRPPTRKVGYRPDSADFSTTLLLQSRNNWSRFVDVCPQPPLRPSSVLNGSPVLSGTSFRDRHARAVAHSRVFCRSSALVAFRLPDPSRAETLVPRASPIGYVSFGRFFYATYVGLIGRSRLCSALNRPPHSCRVGVA